MKRTAFIASIVALLGLSVVPIAASEDIEARDTESRLRAFQASLSPWENGAVKITARTKSGSEFQVNFENLGPRGPSKINLLSSSPYLIELDEEFDTKDYVIKSSYDFDEQKWNIVSVYFKKMPHPSISPMNAPAGKYYKHIPMDMHVKLTGMA
jgi:hypothetical protein